MIEFRMNNEKIKNINKKYQIPPKKKTKEESYKFSQHEGRTAKQ